MRAYAFLVVVAIRKASPERVPALAGLVGRTFADDHLITWPLRLLTPQEAEEATTRWFRPYQESIVGLGMLWEAGDGVGVAAWIPPDSDEKLAEASRVAWPAIAAYTDDDGARLGALWSWIHDHSPDEPHWYLDHIAVAPERQGEGIGVALIDHGLALARSDDVSAFLVTARPKLVPFYERRGFLSVEEATAPGKGPHVWFMRRDP